MFGFLRNRRRKNLLAQPLADEWRQIIERNVAVYPLLSAAEQQRLVGAARIVAAERRFEGCKGLAITEEIRVTIAVQAALLLLGEDGYYFDRVRAFLVYPYAVVVQPLHVRPDDDDEDRVASGVAHHEGQIVLSWPDVLQGGKNASDAQNVVLHELAHHLDGLDGEMGGSPPAATEADRKRWRDVLGRELHGLRQDLTEGRRTLLHPPAADSMTEVFAYGTECFFEKPLELRTRHPELFACFRDFYKVDPCVWFERAGQHGDVQSMDKRRTGQRPKPKRCDGDDRAPRKLSALRTSDEYFTRGLEYFQRGRYEQAESDFNQAVRLAPEDQEALVYRAESRLWLDHVEAALADADRACHLDPSDTHSRRIRGICRVTLGQDQDGLDDLADTVEADDPDALLCRGVARSRVGRHREALADLTRVIELEPNDAEAYFERANCHEELGNSAAAERDRAQARELGWVEDGETE